MRHWVDGGTTCLDNALTLCTRHHALVHEGGFRIVCDGAGLRFLRPDGRDVETALAAAAPTAVRFAEDLPPTWHGDPPDYCAAVDALV